MPLLNAPPHDDTETLPGFLSADEVPEELLDRAPKIEEEGDDSQPKPIGDNPGREALRALQAVGEAGPLPPKARARIVPLRRQLKPGMRGKDVVATKRALSHAGYLKWPRRWSLVAGPKWRDAVKRFQKQHRLYVDGIYGRDTHRKLVQLGHFDKWGAKLMAEAPRPPRSGLRSKKRDRIEAYALWAYHNRDRIYYLQRRPMHINSIYELPSWEDCSEYVTRCFKAGDANDPNRRRYDGFGFTGTLADHGLPGLPETAALNFYGSYPYRHVTIGLGSTRCLSMGSSIGPLLLPVPYRSDYAATRVYPL